METVAFFRFADQPSVPVLAELSAHPTYALPAHGQGLKVGWHHSGPEADPDTPHVPDRRVLAHLTEWAASHCPSAGLDHAETCMYTNTADESFILERQGPLVIGSACSGHGFKFAPLVGERLASLAVGTAKISR
jgi:sarcosine oxidase